MFTAIDNAVAAVITLSEEERRCFHKLLKFRRLRKRSFLLQEGDICNFEAFITRGCIRVFYCDAGGLETNLSFAIEGGWVTDLQSFSNQTPSTTFIETLEDTELLFLDHRAKTELLDRLPRFERFFRRLLQDSLITLQTRWHASVTHTAEQRYNSFLCDYPEIAQRLTQTQIARHIGVSPEFLSKMRSLMYRRVS
ncbi:MAG TPA: Crp/Fnr family transcriptional regulator [Puia sp.]|nr:Crp/Fnr family transcriptional regulator [Puia sp.]